MPSGVLALYFTTDGFAYALDTADLLGTELREGLLIGAQIAVGTLIGTDFERILPVQFHQLPELPKVLCDFFVGHWGAFKTRLPVPGSLRPA